MKRIYKYKINAVVELPKGAKIIKVDIQNEAPHMWCLINADEKETESRVFSIVGTGHDIDDRCEFVGTYFQDVFVWHVLEIPRSAVN